MLIREISTAKKIILKNANVNFKRNYARAKEQIIAHMAITTSKQINNTRKISNHPLKSRKKKQNYLRVSTVHIIQKNQLTTAKTTHISQPRKFTKIKTGSDAAPKTENSRKTKRNPNFEVKGCTITELSLVVRSPVHVRALLARM